MQVLLREDVHNLGKAGDLVVVRPGYGRNYLIPQGLATSATAGNIKQVENHKKQIAAQQAAKTKEAQSLADKLSNVEINIERSVGEEDKLFGSVTSRDVEMALKDKGIVLDHKKFVFPEPIKTIGFHTIDVKLGGGIVAKIKVVVTPKQS